MAAIEGTASARWTGLYKVVLPGAPVSAAFFEIAFGRPVGRN